jgi:hypothetical protein
MPKVELEHPYQISLCSSFITDLRRDTTAAEQMRVDERKTFRFANIRVRRDRAV